MKDEEMAEEYIKDLKSKFFLSEPQLDLACQGYKDGFLAGLKAGRPQWHKVADGDLPKDENYVLVSNGKDWTKGFYKDKKWNIISLVGFTKIIMWKEIVLPKEIE